MSDFEQLRQEIFEFRQYRNRCIWYMKIFCCITMVVWLFCMAVILT